MDCPACHAANTVEAVACAACGSALASPKKPSRSARRPNGRRRADDLSEIALDSKHPTAWHAYRLALWSLLPGFGLVLGPLGIYYGWRAARGVGDDRSARNRAKASVLLSAGATLTQWLGLALMIYGWS